MGIVVIEAGDLPVTERNFDRETHTHHRAIFEVLSFKNSG